MKEDSIGKEIVDAAVVDHRELGPGLLKTVFEVVLLDELRKRGFRAEGQKNREWPPGMTGFLCDLCGLAREPNSTIGWWERFVSHS